MMDLLGENAVVLEGLDGDENPLPDAYQISMHDLSKYDETIQQIQAIEGVDHYTDYSDIATKLSNIDMIVRVASLAIIVILAIVSLFIISNTVKVTMFSRPHGNQHYEVRRCNERLRAHPVHRRGHAHRPHFRRHFRCDFARCL